jgi:hypothetical protein
VPSEAEVEAAARALFEDEWPQLSWRGDGSDHDEARRLDYLKQARAALTAAEKARAVEETVSDVGAMIQARMEARTPADKQATGVTPDRGFAGKRKARTEPTQVPKHETGQPCCGPLECADSECWQPESPNGDISGGNATSLLPSNRTVTPIPDEAAVVAGAKEIDRQSDPYRAARIAITAALPHLENEKDKRIAELERERNHFAELYEQATGQSGELESRTAEAAIRADTLAKVRERVEALMSTPRLTGVALARYRFAIDDALDAIDEEGQE